MAQPVEVDAIREELARAYIQVQDGQLAERQRIERLLNLLDAAHEMGSFDALQDAASDSFPPVARVVTFPAPKTPPVKVDGVPETIKMSAITEWVASLGIDPKNLRELHVDRTGIEVVVRALDEDGRPYAAGHDCATHRLRIRSVAR